MTFTVGWDYTRDQIRAVVGGGTGDALPHRDGTVVAGCFRPDLNPDAPDMVLPGSGPQARHWAEQFSRQTEPVPVFLKIGTDRWCYVGRYRVAARSLDPAVIDGHARAAGRGDVSQVLFLEAADPRSARGGRLDERAAESGE